MKPRIPDDLSAPLDIKRIFVKYATRGDVSPDDMDETWEAFKKWYVGSLNKLWKRKVKQFLKAKRTPQAPRKRTLHDLLAEHPEGVPFDVLCRLLKRPSEQIRESLTRLATQGKAVEVGHDTWAAIGD